MYFEIADQLQRDCHPLVKLNLCHVLLNRNAGVPWFILVPETDVIEMVDLPQEEQQTLSDEIHLMSQFVREQFNITKLNVAAIGNIVSQLHVHVVGRHTDDYCWPGVVWGTSSDAVYSESEIKQIGSALSAFIIK